MSDNIKVVVKVRPLIARELDEKLTCQWRVKNNTLHQIDPNGKEKKEAQSFTFDTVYDQDTQTIDVFNDVAKPIVEAAIEGFNGTIFAYGQTSSGKTYTMTGTDDSPGIIPLAVLHLFDCIKSNPDRDFLVRVSYIEIYNETLRDLLNVDNELLKIKETFGGVKVQCTEEVTTSPEDVLRYMKMGEANRKTASTNMNEESSRSHSIFQIIIESREHIEDTADDEDRPKECGSVNVSQLNLVDLAGSERAGQTGATGKRFIEGTHINKSLSTLALVIKQLFEDPNRYINYRDSKLTHVLRNSLGGNAKTSVICAVTPAAVDETISTLQFANRAKAIKNKPEKNAVASDASMILSLTKQLSQLQAQLDSKKNIEKDNVMLSRQIQKLKKLIMFGLGQTALKDAGDRTKMSSRRKTISTPYSYEDDSAKEPGVQFHTPLLKFNPILLPNPSGLGSRLSNLKPVPEENITSSTKQSISPEIIEIDSDEEKSTEIQPCSPYHECFDARSKTPPCILRKSAKQATKSLKDILELTEREKLYPPDVLEYMAKLDENAVLIENLTKQVECLQTKCNDKDAEIGELNGKIKKLVCDIEELTSTKSKLEISCQENNTKLVDLEVSYETLKRKFKIREKELLLLLSEHQEKEKAKINNNDAAAVLEMELINFMNTSKDISRVHNEDYSIELVVQSDIIKNEDKLEQNKDMVDLRLKLNDQQEMIRNLENENSLLNNSIQLLKSKLVNLDGENSLLRSSLDNANSNITFLKSNLEKAHNQINDYESISQEFQKIFTDPYNDLLVNAVINEDKIAANNEDLNNILYSFKNFIQEKNKIIQSLLEKIDKINEDSLVLNKEKEHLTEQLNETTLLIDRLKDENTNFIKLEEAAKKQLDDLKKENLILINKNADISNKIESLSKSNEVFTIRMQEEASKKLNLTSTVIKEIKRNLYEIDPTYTQIIPIPQDVKLLKDFLSSSIDNLKHIFCVCFNEYDKDLIDEISTYFAKIKGNVECLENLFSKLNKNLDDAERKLELVNSETLKKDSIIQSLRNQEAKLNLQIRRYCDQIVELSEKTQHHESLILESHINKMKEIISYLFEFDPNLKFSLDEITANNCYDSIFNILNALKLRLMNSEYFANDHSSNLIGQNIQLQQTEINSILKKVYSELQEKSEELDNLRITGEQWKNMFLKVKEQMKNESDTIQLERCKINDLIKTRTELDNLENFPVQQYVDTKSSEPLKTLFTLSFNKVRETISSNDRQKSIPFYFLQNNCNACKEMLSKLNTAYKKVSSLEDSLAESKTTNYRLVKEQNEAQSEITLLVNQLLVLNKKIWFHKTNLSTLSATTYAENKLLKSQVKVYEHDLNICKKDIAFFKKQLQLLLNILDNSIMISFCPCSQYNEQKDLVFDNYEKAMFCDESTLDGDILMLDTNVTLSNDTKDLKININSSEISLEEEISSDILMKNLSLHTIKSNETYDINQQELVKREVNFENSSLSQHIKYDSEKYKKIINARDCDTDSFINDEIQKLKIQLEEAILDKFLLEKELGEFKTKCNNITLHLEGLKTDLFEKEQNINKVNKILDEKNTLFNQLQEENDLLSTQVIDLISESDSLKKELEESKEKHNTLLNKLQDLKSIETNRPSLGANDMMSDKYKSPKTHKQTDFLETTSPFSSVNKDRHKVSTIATITKDLYIQDKMECLQYFIEKTGLEKENVNHTKILDIMKIFYNYITSDYGNKVENLVNKIKLLEDDLSNAKLQYANMKSELDQKNNILNHHNSILNTIKNNISRLKEDVHSSFDTQSLEKFIELVLKLLHSEYNLDTSSVLEETVYSIINKYKIDLQSSVESYEKLQSEMNAKVLKLNECFIQMKTEIKDKDEELNSLKHQAKIIRDASDAITLSVTEKEKELQAYIQEVNEKLLEKSVILNNTFDSSLCLKKNIECLADEMLRNHYQCNTLQSEYRASLDVIHNLKLIISENEKVSNDLRIEKDSLVLQKELLNKEIVKKEDLLAKQISLYKNLNEIYETKTSENNSNLLIIDKLSEENNILIESVHDLDKLVEDLNTSKTKLEVALSHLSEKNSEIAELKSSKINLEQEIINLKCINDIILKEKNECELKLKESEEKLEQKSIEVEKLMMDITAVKATLKDNVNALDSLKTEAHSLFEQNEILKAQFEKKCEECIQLKLNIKTHEKAVEIQNGMMLRLKKEREEEIKAARENEKKIEDISNKYDILTREYHVISNELRHAKEELTRLATVGKSMELEVDESECAGDQKSRSCLETIKDNNRKRRQSIQDSRRSLEKCQDFDEELNGEVYSDIPKMESEVANKDLPTTNITKRIGVKKEESVHPSSGVQASRRRRQSVHDLRRRTMSPTRPLLDNLSKQNGETSELLTALEQTKLELEELKQRYKELDEECETCAEYLREKEQLCIRLKKEKNCLEKEIAELKKKLDSPITELSKKEKCETASFSHAAVNTDEDWSNLHAVVVDRMSFDAEVEKNKKLSRSLDDFRLKNRELKHTIGKMHRALEDMRSHSADKDAIRRLESTRRELAACKRELEEWSTKCQQLHDELANCRRREAKLGGCEDLSLDNSSSKELKQFGSSRSTYTDATTETCEELLSFHVERDDEHSRQIQQLRASVETLQRQKAALEQRVMTGSAIVQNQTVADVMKDNHRLKRINEKLIQLCQERGKTITEDKLL